MTDENGDALPLSMAAALSVLPPFNLTTNHPIRYGAKAKSLSSLVHFWSDGKTSCNQFIGRPQTFVELQLRFKQHFYTKKM